MHMQPSSRLTCRIVSVLHSPPLNRHLMSEVSLKFASLSWEETREQALSLLSSCLACFQSDDMYSRFDISACFQHDQSIVTSRITLVSRGRRGHKIPHTCGRGRCELPATLRVTPKSLAIAMSCGWRSNSLCDFCSGMVASPLAATVVTVILRCELCAAKLVT